MRGWIAITLAVLGLAGTAHANHGVSFVADRYYFELSYGKDMEFYQETQLPASTIWKLHFRSVLRIELRTGTSTYPEFGGHTPAETARIAWNSSRTRVLATFGEHAFILSPQFDIRAAYRNTSGAHWVTNDEIEAIVEVGGVSPYATGVFRINVATDRFHRTK